MSKTYSKIRITKQRKVITSGAESKKAVYSASLILNHGSSTIFTAVQKSIMCRLVVLCLLFSFTLQGAFFVSAAEIESDLEVVPGLVTISDSTLEVEEEPDQLIEVEELDTVVIPTTVESSSVENSEMPELSELELAPLSDLEDDSSMASSSTEYPVLIAEETGDTGTSSASGPADSETETTPLEVTEVESATSTPGGTNSGQSANEADTSTTDSGPETDEESSVESDTASSSTTPAEETEPEVSPEPQDELVSISYSDSEVRFNKDACTELASGSFYCLPADEEQLKDKLFAAPDSDGDLEIYLVKGGEQFKITDNTVDDAAPFYDQNSETIVWHRLIDDRYQIVSYDIETGQEVQITRNSTNNMEPTRQGNFTVWQRWVNTSWEIMLWDGKQETQLTDSVAHDIAPYVHGSLIVWNRHTETGEKTIEIYDMGSDSYVTVQDPEGLSVTNPRMVFVYDSLDRNGDVTTKGYDVLARKFIDLSTLPKSLPDEIPHSDSTGETRALIQSKPTIKSELEELTGDDPIEPNPEPVTDTLASTTALTLDLSQASTTVEEVKTPEVVIEEYDLVILPLTELETSGETAVQE